jgi:hypothetical protein
MTATKDPAEAAVAALLRVDLYDPDDPDDGPARQSARIEAFAGELEREASAKAKAHRPVEAALARKQAEDMRRLARRLRALTVAAA